MPAFLKTEHDEKLWSEAKAAAARAGRANDWAYVNGIYQRMKAHAGGGELSKGMETGQGPGGPQEPRNWRTVLTPQGFHATVTHRNRRWVGPNGATVENLTFVHHKGPHERRRIEAYLAGAHLGTYDTVNRGQARRGLRAWLEDIGNRALLRKS